MIAPRAADRDDSEGVVQVTFVRAFQSLGKFRGEAAFSTWLTRIALNVANSHQRSWWTRSQRFLEGEDVDTCLSVDWDQVQSESLEDALEKKELRERLLNGIAGLPSQYREAMWLRYVKELSYKEITRELGVPMGTVKTWLCRGRRHLTDTSNLQLFWAMLTQRQVKASVKRRSGGGRRFLFGGLKERRMNFQFEIQKFERMWTCESLAEFHKAGWITDVLYRVKGGKEAMRQRK